MAHKQSSTSSSTRRSKIGRADLHEFLKEHKGDMAFEMAVLAELTTLNYTCDYGGFYTDAATNKECQFDIRARKLFGADLVRMAVECKNIREDAPLLVHTLPRQMQEAHHYIAEFPESGDAWDTWMGEYPPRNVFRLDAGSSPYSLALPVGKSMDQVTRDEKGILRGSDGEVFAKWSQAMRSAYDLVKKTCFSGQLAARQGVLAVLVVPDDRLWVAEFNSVGSQTRRPQPVNHVHFYVGKTWKVKAINNNEFEFGISHLDIVTLSGLKEMLDRYFSGQIQPALFPKRR